MRFVVLARLYLDGQNLTAQCDDEIQLAPFLVVVIICGDAVRRQLLRYGVLINRVEIDVLVSVDNA